MKLTETIAGVSVDITIDQGGIFRATIGEEELRADKLVDLKELIAGALKKDREQRALPVTVLRLVPRVGSSPFSRSGDPYMAGDGIVHALLRGKHERQSKFLLTSDSGQKFGIDSYEARRIIARRMTETECQEWLRLNTVANEAKASLANYEKGLLVDPDAHLKYGG